MQRETGESTQAATDEERRLAGLFLGEMKRHYRAWPDW